MKKKIAFLLTAILACSAVPVYAGVPATPNASKVLVNGESKAFEAYTINDSNYFKLRDIAYVLNGTGSAFSVGWDSTANCIFVATGESYAPTGTEMQVSGTKDIKDAVESTSAILIDGAKATLNAYTINGSNYFKLRDLGTALGFDVGWDSEVKTIAITSADFIGGYGGPGEDYVSDESETLTLTEEQMTEMGFFNLVERTGMYPYEMSVVFGIPKTSEIVDFQVDKFYVDGKENTAVAAKLPGGDYSYFWDDSLNQFVIHYFFDNTPIAAESSYDYTLILNVTLTDGNTYSFMEKGILEVGGWGGDTSWGYDNISPEMQAYSDKLQQEYYGR